MNNSEGQTQEPVGGMKSLPSIDEAGVIAVRISGMYKVAISLPPSIKYRGRKGFVE